VLLLIKTCKISKDLKEGELEGNLIKRARSINRIQKTQKKIKFQFYVSRCKKMNFKTKFQCPKIKLKVTKLTELTK
jgi:arginyl-tRNA--protein-N-Asp/Glu arginylyltransferase